MNSLNVESPHTSAFYVTEQQQALIFFALLYGPVRTALMSDADKHTECTILQNYTIFRLYNKK